MSKPYYLTLVEATEIEVAGGKAVMLGGLLRAGARTVDGGVITTTCLKDFLVKAGHSEVEINQALHLESAPISAIRRTVASAPWPESLLADLQAIYCQFDRPLVVRSSAVSEDGTAASFAGIYRSNLNIRSFGEFLQCLRDCWLSAFEEQSVRYVQNLGATLPLMAVVVQPLVDSTAAGVAFLENGRLQVSAAYGLGEGVVSGRVPCDSWVWELRGAQPTVTVKTKSSCYVANVLPWAVWAGNLCDRPWGKGKLWLRVLGTDKRQAVIHGDIHPAQSMRWDPVLDEADSAALADFLYSTVDAVLGGGNWDLEWCIDQAGEMFLVQARPLTASLYTAPATQNSDALVTGQPISVGVGVGPARLVTSDEDLERVHDGDVLVMNWVPDSYIGILSRGKALVIGDGSALSHCAIVAREWRIPCVGGVPEGVLTDGQWYKVDGSAGHIFAMAESESLTATPAAAQPPPTPPVSVLAWLFAATDDCAVRVNLSKRYLRLLRKEIQGLDGRGTIDLRGIAEAIRQEQSSGALMQALLLGGLQVIARWSTDAQVLAHAEDQAWIQEHVVDLAATFTNRWNTKLVRPT